MLWCEITKQAFDLLVTSDTQATRFKMGKFCRITHYSACGVELKQVDSFLQLVSQYYIRDINA